MAIAFNLWVMRGARLSVAYPNDSAVHLQMVESSHALVASGRFPLGQWYPNLSLGSSFFVQYQSFSAILVGMLGGVVSTPVAFAWSLYLLVALWPIPVYIATRLFGWERSVSGVAAALSPLLFAITVRGFGDQSYSWLGPGLWSQLWAMWTLPLAWALSWRYISRRQYLLGACLSLSLTIAFHFLTAYLAGLSIVVWIVLSRTNLARRAMRAAILAITSLLASLWVTIPLLADAKWTGVDQFQVNTTIANSYGGGQVLSWLVRGDLFDSGRLPVLTVVFAVGLLICIRRARHDERARALIAVFVLSLVLFIGRPTLSFVLNLLPGQSQLLFQRYIMGVQLAGILIAAVGVVSLSRYVVRGFQRLRPQWTQWLRDRGYFERGTVLVGVVVLILALTPAWSEVASYGTSNLQWIAYQQHADSVQGRDVADLLSIVASSSDGGRVYAGLPSNWGHDFKVGAVPVYLYMTQFNVDAVGLTLRTSSLMTVPEAYFDEDNPADYVMFGVNYLLLPSGMTPPVTAQFVQERGPYALWSVNGGGLVQVASTIGPSLVANGATIGAVTYEYLHSDLASENQYPTIAYAGAPGARPTTPTGFRRITNPGFVVSSVDDLSTGRVVATVVAHQRAVVILKSSFDPGWHVSVDGRAAHVVMVAPALMAVDVGPGRHRVVFEYEGDRDYPLLVATAIMTLFVIAAAPSLRRRVSSARSHANHR